MAEHPEDEAAQPDDGTDAGAAAGRRALFAARRAAELLDRRQRLLDGERITEHDVEAAQRAALTEHDLNEQAHLRAAVAHGRAAHAHLAAAESLEAAGHHDRAEAHRQAAAAELVHDEAEQREATRHHHEHPDTSRPGQ